METSGPDRAYSRQLLTLLLIFSIVTGAVSLVSRLKTPAASLLIIALWGFGGLIPDWRDGLPPPDLGFARIRLIKSIRLYLLSSAVVFPLYGTAYSVCLHLGFRLPAAAIPPGVTVLKWIVYNLTIVAFVEELFFRGYLQGRLENLARSIFPGTYPAFWLPIAIAAFLFGAAHAVVALNPARMVVFFPGLLFGWLRAKSGALLAPVLSHGSANVISWILMSSMTG